MLFRNDIFIYKGNRYRLLHVEQTMRMGWVIGLGLDKGVPLAIPLQLLQGLDATSSEGASRKARVPSNAMLKSQIRAMAIIGTLPDQVPEIFDAKRRSELISHHSETSGYSRKAIYKNLRRYWAGGQVPSALLGRFEKCGVVSSLTNGRGPKTSYGVYQLTEHDHKLFNVAIASYLADPRKSIEDVYYAMLAKHFVHSDSPDSSTLFSYGERPTVRQFRHYLNSHYSVETRLRNRKGEANFNLESRAVLGTVMDDCVGVAHYYECDATIGDVLLVAESDPTLIVGKPTVYFIVDRRSRLIVGFYAGLENANWVCAMQATFTISQNKQELCEQYGVKYEPADWPAHEIFPKQMLFDRGEGYSNSSNRLAENLAVTVANPPALRPDWKPIVESRFKFMRQRLQGEVYGFVVPEDALKRRNKTGVAEREACLSLREFNAILLNLIIAHNHTPLKKYSWGPGELASGMIPTPINIWNYDIANRSGFACRYAEDFVRMSLLPQGDGTITRTGVVFNGCFFGCKDSTANGLFVQAGNGAIDATVSFDSRLIDEIYLHHPNKKGEIFKCKLTSASERFRGLSLPEVMILQKLEKSLEPGFQQVRDQVKVNFKESVDEIQRRSLKRLKDAGVKKTRTSRKADTKQVRARELTTERKETVPRSSTVLPNPEKSNNVLPMRREPLAGHTSESPTSASTKPRPKLQEMARQAREKMSKGQDELE
jgi:putative transposase